MALTWEDKAEILELSARYSHAFDTGDPDTWASTFAPDGVFVSDPPVQGTEALAAFARERWSGHQGRIRHWTSNHVIDGDGDSASHRCYLFIGAVGTDEPPKMAVTGIYRDDVRRVNGAWRFARRQMTRDPQPAPQS